MLADLPLDHGLTFRQRFDSQSMSTKTTAEVATAMAAVRIRLASIKTTPLR